MTDYHLISNPNPSGPNFYPTRRSPIALIVAHTAENLPYFKDDVDKGAENVSNYGATTTRDVSWHVTVDSDSIVWMLPDDHTAWHVRGYNSPSLGMEIATQAHRWDDAPDDWLDGVVDNVAKVWAIWSGRHDIPLIRISKADADNGKKGVVAHADLDPSRRTDPGEDFPWDRVLAAAREKLGEGGETEPAPSPAPEPKPEPKPKPSRRREYDIVEPFGLIRRGASGFDARLVQALLAAHDHPPANSFSPKGVPDGAFGPKTESAVTDFQQANSLGVDGIAGPQTLSALLVSDLSGTYVGRDRNANSIHAAVAQACCMANQIVPANSVNAKGEPDGVFGYHTERAVKKLQKTRRVKVDGLFGPTTLRAALHLST